MARRSSNVLTAVESEANINLPTITSLTGSWLDQITTALHVDRSVVASDEQIGEAWSRLPRLIRRIPPELRDDKIVKACIAVGTGLFDSAINYVWNAAIVELRQKVRRFGLQVIPQILDDKSFDEESLLDLKDVELLDLCLRLNLMTDQDFFFLDQCRATRNSYSVAHPSDGTVDEDEVLNFMSRCLKHALSSTQNPKGVDTKKLLNSLRDSRFTGVQCEEWESRLRATFDAQRELIFGMLHGVFCDPDAGEEARLNALAICHPFREELPPKTKSMLVDRHQDYKAKGDEERYTASQSFFQQLGLISLLGDSEVHSLITSASRHLLRIHNDFNNFYNEPPFAARLEQITKDAVPQTAQEVFVEAVVTCGVGNTYGVSNAAMPSYFRMVKSFSPREVLIMLTLPKRAGTVANRLTASPECKERFRELVHLLDKSSVPTAARSDYEKWLTNNPKGA